MLVPSRLGNTPTHNQYIFTAGDSKYFELHGKPLITSILTNTDYHIHVHIYNPTKDQLEWVIHPRITCSYEKISEFIFDDIADEWMEKDNFLNHREKQMYDKGLIHGREIIKDIMVKTYYACARFIRLNEIFKKGHRCLAIDMDGIVRKKFPITFDNEVNDIFLFKKPSNEYLAGAILFTERSKKILSEFSSSIHNDILADNMYWFLDQIHLDKCIKDKNPGELPMSYIDWEMTDDSYIWSAKGKRKYNIMFTTEQKKYTL